MARILSCVAVLLMLCGCADYNELNMQELVNGAGVDVRNDEVLVNVLCAATGSVEEKKGAKYTSSGKSFFDAVRTITGEADRKLYWGHCRCLVFGESAINSIDTVLDTVLRAQDIYLDIAPVVVRGESAEKLLKAETAGGRDIMDTLSDAFANEANSRHFHALRVWEILRERERSGVYILPAVTIDKEVPRVSGGAVIRDGRLSGYLSGEQMLFFSLMTESGGGGYLPPIELSDGRQVSFEILGNEIKRKDKDGKTVFLQSCVLSPAEVRGNVSDDEMQRAAKSFLERSFGELHAFAKQRNMGDIFKTRGKDIAVESEVVISNILGGA